jgi:hypothetical protein
MKPTDHASATGEHHSLQERDHFYESLLNHINFLYPCNYEIKCSQFSYIGNILNIPVAACQEQISPDVVAKFQPIDISKIYFMEDRAATCRVCLGIQGPLGQE